MASLPASNYFSGAAGFALLEKKKCQPAAIDRLVSHAGTAGREGCIAVVLVIDVYLSCDELQNRITARLTRLSVQVCSLFGVSNWA